MPQPTTITVTGTAYRIDGTPAPFATLTFNPSGADKIGGGLILDRAVTVKADAAGAFSVTLWTSDEGVGGVYYDILINPAGNRLPSEMTQLVGTVLTAGDNPRTIDQIVTVGPPPALSEALQALAGAQAAEAKAKDWATKTDGEVEPGLVSAKQSALDAAAEKAEAEDWATGPGEIAPGQKSAKSYAEDGQAALSSILDLFDQFVDRYLGQFNSHPTEEEDGDPLEPGASYFNPTVGDYGVIYIWTGSEWVSQTLIVQALRDEVITAKAQFEQLLEQGQGLAAVIVADHAEMQSKKGQFADSQVIIVKADEQNGGRETFYRHDSPGSHGQFAEADYTADTFAGVTFTKIAEAKWNVVDVEPTASSDPGVKGDAFIGADYLKIKSSSAWFILQGSTF